MIGTINIKVNAAHPNMPLAPLYAFIGSPSQVRVIDVPKQIGNWKITAVQITANYPDNSAQSVECVLDGGCWHGTLPASTAVGQSLVGFKVTASGVKEDGTTAVTGYVLGAGDVFILNTDSTITVGSTTYYVHLVDSVPATPKKGDLAVIDGIWKIYTGSAWSALGSSTTVAWNDITGKPSTFPPEAHTHTKIQITDFPEAMPPTSHASRHATNGSDAITPAAIGADVAGAAATAKTEAIAACDPSGAATAAVTAHNSANDAHSTLFSGKVNKSGDTMTGNLEITNQDGYPKVIVGSTQYQHEGIFTESSWLAFPSDVSDTIAVAGDIPDVSGKANISDFSLPPGGGSPSAQYVSSLFSSENTSLVSAVHTIVDAYYDNAETTNYPVS